MDEAKIDSWLKCYGEGWTGIITPESFCHPAKFSRALIRRIYAHAIEEGWVKEGSVVIDPFGGVALGGLEAMRRGMHWIGVELEARFCALAQANIDLWNGRYAGQMPHWGTAVIVQGDSRRLGEMLERASLCLSSPPWANTLGTVNGNDEFWQERERRWGSRVASPRRKEIDASTYGKTEGNLGNLPDTGFEAALAISSPVYSRGTVHGGSGLKQHLDNVKGQDNYGDAPGQLAQMPEGDHAEACERPVCCVASPPYVQSPIAAGSKGRFGNHTETGSLLDQIGYSEGYGNEEGQLVQMPPGSHAEALEASAGMARTQVCISSPPYEGCDPSGSHVFGTCHLDPNSPEYRPSWVKKWNGNHNEPRGYGKAEGNLGQETGSTFWAASRKILEQVYQVLMPGGHAIFVCKRFVRNKEIIDFPLQWARLCEAVGFRWIHHHKAWLVENRGAQHTLDGGLEERQVKRMSFFRRLHTAKYPHLEILWEDVLCFQKPLGECLTVSTSVI